MCKHRFSALDRAKGATILKLGGGMTKARS